MKHDWTGSGPTVNLYHWPKKWRSVTGKIIVGHILTRHVAMVCVIDWNTVFTFIKCTTLDHRCCFFQLRCIAIDSSVEACKLTLENACLNGVSDRLEVLTQTWSDGKKHWYNYSYDNKTRHLLCCLCRVSLPLADYNLYYYSTVRLILIYHPSGVEGWVDLCSTCQKLHIAVIFVKKNRNCLQSGLDPGTFGTAVYQHMMD